MKDLYNLVPRERPRLNKSYGVFLRHSKFGFPNPKNGCFFRFGVDYQPPFGKRARAPAPKRLLGAIQWERRKVLKKWRFYRERKNSKYSVTQLVLAPYNFSLVEFAGTVKEKLLTVGIKASLLSVSLGHYQTDQKNLNRHIKGSTKKIRLKTSLVHKDLTLKCDFVG